MKNVLLWKLSLTACILALLCGALFTSRASAGMFDIDEIKETEIGEEVAKAIIREYGLIQDQAELDRLMGVTRALVKVCGRPELAYNFYILNTDMVNAFALPGGYIFVTRGLMDEIVDDDELAAVVGHELVHVALRHSVVSYKRGMKNMIINLLVLALTREPAALMASEMIQQGREEMWGRQAEIDADIYGTEYVVRAGYDPAAMMRFFEKMNRLEMKRAPIYEGYFDVHPPTEKRIEIVKKHLKEMNLDVPDSTGYKVQARVYAREKCNEQGECVGLVMNGSLPLMELAAAGDSATVYERARETAVVLNRLLDLAPNIYDIKSLPAGDDPAIWILDRLAVRVLPEDAVAAGISPDALANQWKENLKNFIWSDIIKDDY